MYRQSVRSSFFTKPIWYLALAFVLLCLGSEVRQPSVRAQISPGPLAKAHQSLSGSTNCTKCHDLGRHGAEQLKCLECHTEIRDRIAQRRGMHAIWVGAGGTSKECARCHSDHNGADFPLIHWEPSREALDHTKTGFALTGKHAGLKCEQCHNPQNISEAARNGIQVKDLKRTYLGLSSACASCHVDEHRGQVGKDCARCHTVEAWKPASLFSHANAKYKLTGAHEKTACAKCHTTVTDAKPYVKYTGIPFSKCTACHTDPHKGSFAGTCESCHNTTKWLQIAQLQNFDHSKTKYPLLGKHQTVECSGCHTHGDFKTPVPFAQCMDCHKEAHKGQFRERNGGECAACHTVNGFKPSTFTVKDHTATKYPLEGKHAAVVCDKCHLPKGPKGEDTIFKITQTQCKDCHEDVHKGQFANAPWLNRCESCHDVQGFPAAHFALTRHKETRFPLTGAHSAVLCADCHKPMVAGTQQPLKYHFEDVSCTACHIDPHKGEFQERMRAKGKDGAVVGCTACHTTARWKELNQFDHSKTAFPLQGAHRSVGCADCHIPAAMETSMKNVDFRAASKQCSGCHADVHGGQFATRKDATDCSSCHNLMKWKPAEFDHDKRTPFSLEGAHRNVPCDGCHKLIREVNGKAIVIYKPTPRECKACHGNT